MTVLGKIKNGKVVLENPKAFPDGTDVEVRATKKKTAPRGLSNAQLRAKAKTHKPPQNWYDKDEDGLY